MVEEKTCWVCFGDEDDGPLVQPCACSGSAQWIHKHCLEQWRRTGPREDAAYRCGLCMDRYRDALSLELLSARLQAERMSGQSTVFTLNTLAGELNAQGKYDEAEPLYREALERQRGTLGNQHQNTLKAKGDLAAAEQLRRERLEAQRDEFAREKARLHAQVLGALAAPIDPVRIEALRRQRRVLVAQDLLVRVNLESRAASAPGRNGGLGRLPTSWTLCRCELLSDRQLQISRVPVAGGNPADKGELLGTIDLRSAFNVHLVLVPTSGGPGAGDLSCLQVRTARFVYEFRSEVRGGLARWREPLEQLVMLQLTTRQQGWLHLLQPEAQSQVRHLADH